ncbi:hypothetical protein FQN55_001669 [Onygenales sp. PD_40]|nr:hypothetical protein FQN55_001669 [Onygenales sp. PD_40]
MDSSDPCNWSIDQVVYYLCHTSPAPWVEDDAPLPRPDPVDFEKSLRSNDITGKVLLTRVDETRLRQILGLASLGQCDTILEAIEHLQKQSRKYAERSRRRIPSSSQLESPLIPPGSQLESPRIPPGSQLESSRFSPGSQLESPRIPPGSQMETPRIPPNPFATSSASRPPTELPKPQESSSALSTRRRKNEKYVTDSAGKKRRKLSLNQPQPLASKPVCYLPPSKLSMADVFYNNMEDSDDETFLLTPAEAPAGQKVFVKKALQHYFRQEPQPVKTEDGKDALALFPYNLRLLAQGVPHYFTLFTPDQEQQAVDVTKEDAAAWPQLDNQSHPFDYLLAKYPPEDDHEGLPPYGESSDDGSDLEDIENEIEPATESKELSKKEVNDIIDGYIDSIKKMWHETKLPTLRGKAHRIWWSKTGNGVEFAETELGHLKKRLQKLRNGMTLSTWNSEAKVKQQCQALDQTVFSIEAEKWKISIFKLEDPPPKLPPTQAPKRPPKPPIPDDEEYLSSEEDNDDVDDMDDFIVPDDIAPVLDDKDRKTNVYPIKSATTREKSESEDQVISPASKRKQQSTAARPRISNSPRHGNKLTPPPGPIPLKTSESPNRLRHTVRHPSGPIEVVDLTNSGDELDESTFEVHTPPLNPVNDTEADRVQLLNRFRKKSEPYSSTPTSDKISLSWEELEEKRDRKQLLMKLVYGMAQTERHKLLQLITSLSMMTVRKRIFQALKNLSRHSNGQHPINDEHRLFLRATGLYISWVLCKRVSGEKGIHKQDIKKSRKEKANFKFFYNHLCEGLRTYLDTPDVATTKAAGNLYSETRPEPRTPTQVLTEDEIDDMELDDNSSTDLPPDANLTPHKKRKRPIKESQEAIDIQRSARHRVENQERQQKQLTNKLQKMGVSNTDPERQAVSFDDPVLYLHPHNGRHVKPHQLSGIQFMWRELLKDEKGQGCLLAHTMGLGKTMQVISLLVTIANAAASSDLKIRHQIPKKFRRSRTLILCPSSLIENWWEELLMWTPPESRKNIGEFRKILPLLKPHERLDELSQWYKGGGILLMSYDIFRSYTLNKNGKVLDQNTHDIVRKQLTEGPNIIVADEAHKMKNRKGGINEACAQFKSKSRIALTGSPISNNLKEYYAMIDWIAPGYLGDFVQFKAKYIEPIEEGLYMESTNMERRTALRKLRVLERDLDPKLNRADISVLKGSLPPKVEFVITVPLTNLQELAYNAYIDSITAGKEDSGNPKLWDWLNILSLVSNHPACFKERIEKRNETVRKASDSDSELVPEDVIVSQVMSPETCDKLNRIFATKNLESLEFSYRAQIADQIIQYSIAANDKVLLFSHSIPTLNYLETHILQQKNRTYFRLDGKTPMASRQAATKNFTKDGTQVFLISTRAGGLGLNIPGANRVIIFDFQFNPTWEEQAVGRAYRLGQNKPVYVYHFLAGGTFEELVHNKTVFKTQLASRVVDKKNPIRAASKADKKYLFNVKPVEQTDLAEFKGKDQAVLDRVIANREHNIRKITLTETFQREDNDTLTAEELKSVQEELDDERLKRNDPVAWAKKNNERLRRDEATRSIPQYPVPYHPAFGARPYIPPSTSQPFGPPALRPDTSISAQPQQHQIPGVISHFQSIPQASPIAASPASHAHGPSTPVVDQTTPQPHNTGHADTFQHQDTNHPNDNTQGKIGPDLAEVKDYASPAEETTTKQVKGRSGCAQQ